MNSENDAKVALEMLQHEGNLVWSRFSVFLVANSIIMAALVLLLDQNGTLEKLQPFFTGAGLGLCVLWLILTAHGFFRCRDYREKAKRCSALPPQGKGMLPPVVAFLTIGLFLLIYSAVWYIHLTTWGTLVLYLLGLILFLVVVCYLDVWLNEPPG
jgi:hypothetical protein